MGTVPFSHLGTNHLASFDTSSGRPSKVFGTGGGGVSRYMYLFPPKKCSSSGIGELGFHLHYSLQPVPQGPCYNLFFQNRKIGTYVMTQPPPPPPVSKNVNADRRNHDDWMDVNHIEDFWSRRTIFTFSTSMNQASGYSLTQSERNRSFQILLFFRFYILSSFFFWWNLIISLYHLNS